MVVGGSPGYLACMSEFATFIAFVVAQAIAVFLVVKLVPGAITKYVNKEIERRSDIKLEW
ncbi:MAG: hypothetical protein WA978_09780 [Sphingopyxis granuli]